MSVVSIGAASHLATHLDAEIAQTHDAFSFLVVYNFGPVVFGWRLFGDFLCLVKGVDAKDIAAWDAEVC